MEQPEGYVDREHPEYVCKLQRAIYGLKQAPVQFNKKMCGTLKNIGLVGGNIVYIALMMRYWRHLL